MKTLNNIPVEELRVIATTIHARVDNGYTNKRDKLVEALHTKIMEGSVKKADLKYLEAVLKKYKR